MTVFFLGMILFSVIDFVWQLFQLILYNVKLIPYHITLNNISETILKYDFGPNQPVNRLSKLKKAGFLEILVVVEKMYKQALSPCERPREDLSLSGLTSKIHVYRPKKLKDEKPKKTGMPEIFDLE